MVKQKLVIGISMKDQKARTKAFKIAVSLSGVSSVSIEAAAEKAQLEVFGYFDPVVLICLLRKMFAQAQILSVGPAADKKAETPTPQTVTTTSFALPYPPPFQDSHPPTSLVHKIQSISIRVNQMYVGAFEELTMPNLGTMK
ncbi:PREDICTED: heavy metal-associated isoprenylated plant protein 39-like isoform X2 [Ipomoea nil]|uniref:heavy metal-associated isoprenylated plant protein 39-like isoform X2 n=1 Tax=Ipomoea nil TaxID=35883 RepID=UPI0009017D9D|nr:PREDICTED: heavy metal-associated isoprenylated plant protein 39-like isoform X2 [Ipomoea nil]